MSNNIWFTILTPGRSGSTYLQNYFNAYPEVSMFGEIFHPSHIGKFLVKGIRENPLGYLKKRHSERNSPIVGSKSVCGEMTWPSTFIFLKQLKKDPCCKIIYLFRKNLVKHYLSTWHALQVKSYHVFNEQIRNQKLLKNKEIVDLERMERKINEFYTNNSKVENLLEIVDHIKVEYETLFSSHKAILKKLNDYLGIQSPFRINQKLPVKCITNYSFVANKKEINEKFARFGNI